MLRSLDHADLQWDWLFFCWILLSLHNCSCSCVLPRRQPCPDLLKHIQQKHPEGTAQAGTQPKDSSREECHKPNTKRLISAVSLHDNCDHCPSVAQSQLGLGLASPSACPGWHKPWPRSTEQLCPAHHSIPPSQQMLGHGHTSASLIQAHRKGSEAAC